MTVARLVYFVIPEQAIWRIKAFQMTKVFVWLDIISFLIQAAGGSLLSDDDDNDRTIANIGQKVYMGGVGFQLSFILVFLAIIAKFFMVLKTLEPAHVDKRKVNNLVIALGVCLVLIVVSTPVLTE